MNGYLIVKNTTIYVADHAIKITQERLDNLSIKLSDQIVYYFGCDKHTEINDYINNNINVINATLFSEKNIEIVSFENVLEKIKNNLSEFTKLISYEVPEYPLNKIKNVFDSQEKIDDCDYYIALTKMLEIEEPLGLPCLVHFKYLDTTPRFTIVNLANANSDTIPEIIDWYIGNITPASTYINKDLEEGITVIDENFVDNNFNYTNAIEINQQHINQHHNSKAYLPLYLELLLRNYETIHNELELSDTFGKSNDNKLIRPYIAPLIIDNNFNINVPELNNLKIELRVLDRLIYTLIARHPEGILFKNINKYHEEMVHISKILDPDKELTEADYTFEDGNNQINEIAANINGTFLNLMTENVSKFYIISQNDKKAKYIDATFWEKISFENPKLEDIIPTIDVNLQKHYRIKKTDILK